MLLTQLIGSLRARAFRRPSGNHEQVIRKAPRGIRLKKVVLDDETVGVCPVIGDLACVVPSHNVDVRAVCAGRVIGIATSFASTLGIKNEPIHFSIIDTQDCGRVSMSSAAVNIGRIVIRLLACLGD